MMRRATVFALATAALSSPAVHKAPATALAVIRISGPEAMSSLGRLGVPLGRLRPRTATVAALRHPETKELLDRGLVLTFPAPRSFTGEDVAELHVHGGRAVVTSVLEALGSLEGVRMAEPGEFTRRAFFNDKLDLTQVEALADLLHAETEWQRRQALRQMDGELSKAYERWRETLVRCLANAEAVLDFGESEEVDDGVLDSVYVQAEQVALSIERHLAKRHGELIREGVQAVILGPPNAGKSSLLNALAQRQAAIVSPIAGTTRDVIDVTFNLDGFPVVLSDTAGLRTATTDPIELEGIRRARARIEQSQLRLCVLDVADVLSDQCDEKANVPAEITEHIDESTVVILNKSDLCQLPLDLDDIASQLRIKRDQLFSVSCATSDGIPALVRGIGKLLQTRLQMNDEDNTGAMFSLAVTQQRHRENLASCLEALHRVIRRQVTDLVLIAEELRAAVHSIGRITGRVDVEQILDVIFRDFCIGK